MVAAEMTALHWNVQSISISLLAENKYNRFLFIHYLKAFINVFCVSLLAMPFVYPAITIYRNNVAIIVALHIPQVAYTVIYWITIAGPWIYWRDKSSSGILR